MTWCDVATNALPFANDTGKDHLAYWDAASRVFDICMISGNIACAEKMLRQANYSFCKIFPHIINNVALAKHFETVCYEFAAKLDEGIFRNIDNYMVDAYPLFNKYICIN